MVEKNDNGLYGDLLDLEPGLIYSVTNSDIKYLAISLEITLDGSQHKYTVPAEEMVAPLRGLNKSGAPDHDDNFREVAIYRDPGFEKAAVLGRAFLSQVHHHTPPFALPLSRCCSRWSHMAKQGSPANFESTGISVCRL